MSGRAGARYDGWVIERTPSGQFRRPTRIIHPFLYQRKRWCLLRVHFNGVDLRFAMPSELDMFISVMSQNPLPSGRSLVPECPFGRPKNHWLATLPGKAKPWKFRQAICRYLHDSDDVRRFREFYQEQPPELEFAGIYGSFWEAHLAYRMKTVRSGVALADGA
jgi:hypothetical protein